MNNSILIYALKIMSALWFFSLSSCASVEPWQRDVLSKKEMQFNSQKVSSAMDTHFYYSKEGSSGGSGFSGGGCGCN